MKGQSIDDLVGVSVKLIDLKKGRLEDKVIQPVLGKLKDLVHSRYGCRFSYKPLEDLREEEKGLLCSLGPTSKPVKCNGKLLFSICVNDDVVGAAEIFEADHLSDDSRVAIRRVIQMVLESTIVAMGRFNGFAKSICCEFLWMINP